MAPCLKIEDKTMLKCMNDATFAKVTEYYTGPAVKVELETYWNWVYTSFDRYVGSGDATHLNRAVAGSLNAMRYQATIRILGILSAHTFGKGKKEFRGEADKQKLAALKELVDVTYEDEAGTEVIDTVMFWAVRFEELLEGEHITNTETPTFNPEKWEKSCVTMLAKGIANGEEGKLDGLIALARNKALELQAVQSIQ